MDIPESVIRPDCPEYLIGYYDIFWTLDSCRVNGMQIGRIPWTAVDAFAERHGYTDDDILYEDLVYFIFQMDKVYCKMILESSAGQKNTGDGELGAANARSKMANPEW